MTTPLTPVTTFAETIAAGRPEQFEEVVRAAYEAGADRDTLLMAVDVARHQASVPTRVLARAYTTIHQWAWIAARRAPSRRAVLQVGLAR